MFALVNENSINFFAPYTVWTDKNGQQHSPDYLLALTAEERQNLGVYDVVYETRADDRFYIVEMNDPSFDNEQKVVKVTYSATPKDLEDSGDETQRKIGLKTEYIKSVKDTANSILSSTDWTLVRKIERNIDVPSAVVSYRESVVAESNRLETAIKSCKTVEELISVVTSANWPAAE